ncbi:MAG: hypothetical protein ACHQIM_09695 [Sphingobacteriales bacterium]
MKKLTFTAVIILSCLTFKMAGAQIHFSVGVNIGLQPAWGPVGYDHADYYYLPDIGAYYDVPAHQYIYFENNVWVHRAYLPVRYRNYDLYHGYKAVINERNPWERHNVYRDRYAGYRGRHDQGVIRDSRDNRYRNHWNGGGDNGNRGRGQDNGNRGGGHDNGNRDHGNGGDKGHGHGDH